MRCRGGDRVDHRLQRFLVHVHLLRVQECCNNEVRTRILKDSGKEDWAFFICRDHSNNIDSLLLC